MYTGYIPTDDDGTLYYFSIQREFLIVRLCKTCFQEVPTLSIYIPTHTLLNSLGIFCILSSHHIAVALQTVSFKLPEDEVTELEREANQEGKSRSELIRSVLRARHIEEQLEEQVLTQQDKREYENRIAELERRAEELERKLKTRTAEVEAMEGTIEATVDEAVRSVRSDYEDRVEDLKEENQELRDRKVTGLEEANEELADAINDVLAEIATSEQVSGLSEMVEEKADRQWQGTTEQRESLIELREEVRDDLRRDVKRARPLTTKIADWVRHRLP